jgi:hypothetical protein
MKSILLIISFCFVSASQLWAQNPSWMWAKTAGGQESDYGRSVVTDSQGNVYQTGHFDNAIITFGPIILQNSNPGYSEIFVTKYNSAGTVLWAKTIKGNGIDHVYSICEDNKGHIYLAGSFGSDTLSADTVSMVKSAFQDMFIIQLDTNGNAQWMRNEQGPYNEFAYAVTTDHLGNAIVTGIYGSPTWVLGADTIYNHGSEEVFIIKYDSLGNILWARSAGGSDFDIPTSITTDLNDDIIVAGSFKSAKFNADTISVSNHGVSTDDAFLIKYSAQGDVIWVKGIGGTGNDQATCVKTDDFNQVVICGYYHSPYILFGNDSLSNAGKSDMLLAKLNAQGNPTWARKIGGAELDEAYSLAIDKQNNIIVAGNFGSSQLTIGLDAIVNHGNMDICIARYDQNGQPHSAQSVGNSLDDIVLSIDVDVNNRVVLTGYYFSLILTFGSNTIFNSGASFFPEAFVAKLDSTTVIVSGLISTNETNLVALYPNPAQHEVNVLFTLLQSSEVDVELMSITGKQIMKKSLGYYTTGNHKVPIQLEQLAQGIYVLQLKSKDGMMVGKLNVKN